MTSVQTEPAQSLVETDFDCIVIGTGLPESLLASSAQKTYEQKCLILDKHSSYGGLFGQMSSRTLSRSSEKDGEDCLGFRGWHTEESSSSSIHANGQIEFVRVGTGSDEEDFFDTNESKEYQLDISYKFCLGSDKMIEEICESGAFKYLEFKTVERSYVGVRGRRSSSCDDGDGSSKKTKIELAAVPSSRAEIFESKWLTRMEKRTLMRFLKRARDSALEGSGVNYGRGDDANAPFGAPGTEYKVDEEEDDSEGVASAFKKKLNVENKSDEGGNRDNSNSDGNSNSSETMKSFLMESPNELSEVTSDAVAYCVSFCASAKTPLHGRAANMLKTYIRSMGKFGPETPQAGLVPLYGSGEIAQAFCRVAAVSGAIMALRQPIMKIVRRKKKVDRTSNKYRENNEEERNGEENNDLSIFDVITTGGRVLTCKKLVLGEGQGDIEMVGFDRSRAASSSSSSSLCINRAVLVTNQSIFNDNNDDNNHRVFIAIPSKVREKNDRKYDDEDEFTCFMTQLDSSSKCCPKDKYIVHMCQKSKRSVALKDVFADILENIFDINADQAKIGTKPTILWGATFRTPDYDVSYKSTKSSRDDGNDNEKEEDHVEEEDFVQCPGPDCETTFEETVQFARDACSALFASQRNNRGGGSSKGLFPKPSSSSSADKESENEIDTDYSENKEEVRGEENVKRRDVSQPDFDAYDALLLDL